ncbi:hypothetical protein WJX72_005979 [[Myrmecia] bisecta]|uniref:CNH domain-containing protein n=1 Tax=[Myrmecia] bisecta TaxID=41462 RepID=A0AAW1R751_9CHLO
MAAEFAAFTSQAILDKFQKRVEVVEVWAGRILAGLVDGTLVVLAPDQQGLGGAGGKWQVQQAIKGFGKKYLSQLQVAQSGSLLFSLSEEGVNAYTLPKFKLTCQANRTRGASRFAWDDERAMLCVGCKKRLLLFHYDGKEFVETRELALPEPVLCMAWCGDSVCLGFKNQYATIHAITGALTDLFSTGNKPGAPCMVPVSKTELLLAKDNVGIFIGPDGKPSRKVGLTWSDCPVALAYSRPYVIALLPNYIEVRSAERVSQHGMAQVLPVRSASLAAATTAPDGSAFVACVSDTSTILRLVPVPLADQALQLADMEEFREALTLAALIPDVQTAGRAELEDALHTRYGHHLFAHGEFDEAMAHFGMCSYANPLMLLSLFPSLAAPKMLEPVASLMTDYKLPPVPEPEGEAYTKAVSVLLPYLLSHRSRLASFDEAGAAPDSQEASSDVEAAEAGQGQAQDGEAGPAHARLAGLDAEQRRQLAVLVDTAILKAMLDMSDTGALLLFVQRPNWADLSEGEKALQAAGRYSELVALYQRRGQHDKALDLLQKLSQKPGSLKQAPQGASAELNGLTGVWAAVKYLVSVGGSEQDLVKRHARWILKADPEAGLEMFIQMEPPLPPATVLPVLTAQAPALCAPYLEAVLHNGVADAAEFHDELALIYLRRLLEDEKAQPDAVAYANNVAQANGTAAGSTSGTDSAFDKLKDLISSSEHLDAERLLSVLPSHSAPEIRALLLERLGRHSEALQIYVHRMKDVKKAEAYCDRFYETKTAGRSKGTMPAAAWNSQDDSAAYDMYLALVQVILEREDESAPSSGRASKPSSSTWGEVARLLSRKQDRIEPNHALNLLPGEVPLHVVLPFLEGAIRGAGEQRRNAAVVKSLRKSENLQIWEELIRCKQRHFIVSSERACTICHKRIGSSAFVAYPDGTLVHYSCYKRTSTGNLGASGGSGMGSHRRVSSGIPIV